MTHLRKITGILPLMVMGLLFSIVASVVASVASVLSETRVDNLYIGEITCELNLTGGATEMLTVSLYYDRNLTQPILDPQPVHIYTGGSFGYPRGLIEAVISAQTFRTPVNVTWEYMSSPFVDHYRLFKVAQNALPNDILVMFNNIKVSDINNRISGLSDQLDTQDNDLNYIFTENSNMNATLVDSKNLAEAQRDELVNLYSEGNSMHSLAEHIYNDLNITQTPMITNLTTVSNNVYSVTGSTKNQMDSLNNNVNAVNTKVSSKSTTINNSLYYKDIYINYIYGEKVPR